MTIQEAIAKAQQIKDAGKYDYAVCVELTEFVDNYQLELVKKTGNIEDARTEETIQLKKLIREIKKLE